MTVLRRTFRRALSLATATRLGVSYSEIVSTGNSEIAAIAEAQPIDMTAVDASGPLRREASELLSSDVLECHMDKY
jgi:hypothetical protein